MNRAVMARRAAENGRISVPNTDMPVSRNLLLRQITTVPDLAPVTRSRATKMTGAARCASGSGKRSLWAASQNYRNNVTVDARWSK